MSEQVVFQVDPSSLASILGSSSSEKDSFKRPKGPPRRKAELKATRVLPAKFGYSSEKKQPRRPTPDRMSLSERKAPPDFEPRLFSKTRRELDFKASSNITKQSIAAKLELLARESLPGLPRESLSGLFRQSLNMNELNRLFEDDSTCSFESLEKRLKTPGKLRRKKSLSTTDLSRMTPPNPKEKEGEVVPQKSKSMLRLPTENLPSWITEAQKTLDDVRAESVLLSEQLSELDKRILERRNRFKEAWGVSPKSINKVKRPPADSKESQRRVNVNIPICLHEQSGNMSIAHDGGSELRFHSPERFDIAAPTPMALKHLSRRVQLELSSLYDS